MKRCDYRMDVTPLPNASTHYNEPFLRTMKMCDKPSVVVRWENGIIVEGYCDNHREMKNLSANPWPNSPWRRYSEAEFYLGVKR